MSMTVLDEDYLTSSEAAVKLRVAVSTLIRWRRETRQLGQQIGPPWVGLSRNTILYRASAIAEYMESREQRTDD